MGPGNGYVTNEMSEMILPTSFHLPLQSSESLHYNTVTNYNIAQFAGLFPELSMVDLSVLSLSIIRQLLPGWRRICVNLRLRKFAGRDLVIEENLQLFVGSAFDLWEAEVRPDKGT